MVRSINALLAAYVLLIIGIIQILEATDPEDDREFKLFQQNIQIGKQQAEKKLKSSMEALFAYKTAFNLSEFDIINSKLTSCFDFVNATYANADVICMEMVNQTVQETIYDSKKEVEACIKLSYSWQLIDHLLKGAEDSLAGLNVVVDQIIQQALLCVAKYPYSPALKGRCFQTVIAMYQSEFDQAKSQVQEAYYQISGCGLLMDDQVSEL